MPHKSFFGRKLAQWIPMFTGNSQPGTLFLHGGFPRTCHRNETIMFRSCRHCFGGENDCVFLPTCACGTQRFGGGYESIDAWRATLGLTREHETAEVSGIYGI